MPFEPIVFLLFAATVVVPISLTMIWRAKRKRISDSERNTKGIVSSGGSNPLRRNQIAIADIESIILNNDNGYELALTRPDTSELSEKRYREICVRGSSVVGNVAVGAMPVLAQAHTLGEIAKAAPNGLFTATAPVQDLMKLSGGTVGSAVMKNGKIATQAGFAEVVIGTANPVAIVAGAMQAMALISGQYYMNEISKKLENIDRKLDTLIGYHHDEKVGVLRNVNRELLALASKINVDAADIIFCHRLGKECGEVYFEYLTRLEGINVETKERWLNKPKELRELGASSELSKLDFSIRMCYQASALYEKCKLAEISVRLKIGTGQEVFIAEQSHDLHKNCGEAFHRNILKHIDAFYTPVIEKVDSIAEANTIPLIFGDASKEVSSIRQRKAVISEIAADDGNGDYLTEQMLQYLCEPKETLVILGDTPDTQRVFVLDDEEEN